MSYKGRTYQTKRRVDAVKERVAIIERVAASVAGHGHAFCQNTTCMYNAP